MPGVPRAIEPVLAARADELRRCAPGTPALMVAANGLTRDRRTVAHVDRAPFWDEPKHGAKKIL
jgi:hypothetical protein